MSEDTGQAAVPSYSPPQQVGSNVPDLAALVAAAVAQAEARIRAELNVPAAEPAKSVEELAREALDRGGQTVAGGAMGHDERLAELYRIVSIVASKVGV